MHPASIAWQGGLQVFDIDLDAFARTVSGHGLELLDGEEQRRAERMATAVLQRRFAAAHAATRQILGAALGVDPGSLRFTTSEFGKPCLATHRDAGLHFNLSHCRGRALVALDDEEVGVDLERWIERDTDVLAAEMLAPGEMERFNGHPADEHPRQLARVWAAKEALLKACGLGLQLEPNAVKVDVGGGWHRLPPPADASPWWLQPVAVAGPYCAFVASRRRVEASIARHP